MSRVTLALCAAFLTLFPALASADDEPPLASADDAPPRVGVGVGLSTASAFGSLLFLGGGNSDALLISGVPASFYVPINVTPNIRLEPVVSFVRATNSSTQTSNGSSATKLTTDSTASAFSAGLGAFYVMAPTDPVHLYVGPRFLVSLVSTSDTQSNSSSSATSTTDTSRVGWNLSGVFGGEYYPVPRFAVGAEIALGYASFGTPTKTVTPSSGATSTSTSTDTNTFSTVATNGTIFARFFFL